MRQRFRAPWPRFVLAVTVTGFLAAAPAFPSGFQVMTQGARATGMGLAFAGIADDPSAIFYNPAGIAQGRILDAQIGDSIIVPSARFTAQGGATTRSASGVVPPFQAYLSAGVHDDLSLGVGVFTPYGLTVNWPDGRKQQVTGLEVDRYHRIAQQ